MVKLALGEAFGRALAGIGDSDLYPSFADEVRTEISKSEAGNEISDSVIERLTKWVETELRLITEDFLGKELQGKARIGEGLITEMVDSGLLRNKLGEPEKPIQALLRWYFNERNLAHHAYPSYSWSTFLAFFWISNYILLQVASRKLEAPHPVFVKIRSIPTVVQLGQPLTLRASLNDTIEGAPVVTGKVEARLIVNEREVQAATLSYLPSESAWGRDVSTSAFGLGDFYVTMEAAGPQGHYISRDRAKGTVVPP